jgi:PPOX class probable F420-dependent enzyme
MAETSSGSTVGGLAWSRGSTLDEGAVALLRGKNVCIVSTVGRGGAIHAVPVWVDSDGEHVLLNSLDGRAWVRNLDRDPRVTCTVVDAANPYAFVEIRGRVAERTYDGGNEHIHSLARKYLGLDEYPFLEPGDRRVLFRVAPNSVYRMFPGSTVRGARRGGRPAGRPPRPWIGFCGRGLQGIPGWRPSPTLTI